MTALSFATADLATRRRILEEALAKVLDLPDMEIHTSSDGVMRVWVRDGDGAETGHDLYGIACELEAMLA